MSADTAAVTTAMDSPLNYFDLPMFSETTFAVCNDAKVEDLTDGAYLLIDIANSLADDIASETTQSFENNAHAINVLLGLASAVVASIGRRVNPDFQWAGTRPSGKARIGTAAAKDV
jgi:hypothetical protein